MRGELFLIPPKRLPPFQLKNEKHEPGNPEEAAHRIQVNIKAFHLVK